MTAAVMLLSPPACSYRIHTSPWVLGAAALPPLPACGERVGVRGRFHESEPVGHHQTSRVSCSAIRANHDRSGAWRGPLTPTLSPHAGRGSRSAAAERLRFHPLRNDRKGCHRVRDPRDQGGKGGLPRAASLLPLPACGERVGVRGRFHEFEPVGYHQTSRDHVQLSNQTMIAQARGEAPSPRPSPRTRGEGAGTLRQRDRGLLAPPPKRGQCAGRGSETAEN